MAAGSISAGVHRNPRSWRGTRWTEVSLAAVNSRSSTRPGWASRTALHSPTIRCWISNASRKLDMHRLFRVLLLALCCYGGHASQATRIAAQIPPGGSWRTIESQHFRVTFQAALEGLAPHAAQRAEVAHARLRETLTRAPGGKIDIVL